MQKRYTLYVDSDDASIIVKRSDYSLDLAMLADRMECRATVVDERTKGIMYENKAQRDKNRENS